jgi:hypothetical protein
VEQVKPIPLTMIFADQIVRDFQTQKSYILGVCNRVFAPKFPTYYKSLAIYQAFTDIVKTGKRECGFNIAYWDGAQERVVELFFDQMLRPDRLGITEIMFNFANFPLLRPGILEISFTLDGITVNSSTLKIIEIGDK